MSDEMYNGWKNVETWVVNLWLNNDETKYNKIINAVNGKTVYDSSVIIEAFVRDWNPLIGGMFADIINHSLNQVDWLAIAEGFKSD